MTSPESADPEPADRRLEAASGPPTTESFGHVPAEPPRGASVEPPAGTVLGERYVLEEQIATGRRTTVWYGRDTDLERQVAVKVVGGVGDTDRRLLDRFHREAVAVAQLEHRNVVRLYDFGRHERLHYLVMEYVAGGSLKEADTWHPDPEVVAALGSQAAAGLGAIHADGLVHRDVKPSNLLLDARGVVKVTDFGIAKRLHLRTTLSSEDGLLGTARYLAPEQVRGESAVPASDVFALGLVLWETWTGEPAFQRETVAATALARLHEDLPAPSTVRPGIPEELEAVIARATARGTEVRFRNGRELHDALASVGGRPEQATAGLLDDPGPNRHEPAGAEVPDPGPSDAAS